MEEQPDYTTSRSRDLCGQDCPRKRYWGYEHAGVGLLAPGDSIRLDLGIALHAQLENALLGMDLGHVEFPSHTPLPWEFNAGKTQAEHQFLLDVASEVFIPEIAFRIKNVFNVLLVEGIHKPKLTSNVRWYSREDALLKQKGGDANRYTFSFKTVENFRPDVKLAEAKNAMQNTSEPWAAMMDGYKNIAGTAQVWFEVGTMKFNQGDGRIERISPMTRPYFDGEKFYWSYNYTDDSGKVKTVPKGSKRVFAGDILSAPEYANMLLSTGSMSVVGANFNELIYGPVIFEYDEKRAERWLTQVSEAEDKMFHASRTTQAALEGQENGIGDWQKCLDTFFPQHERACRFCSFTDLCWGGDDKLTQIGKLYQLKRKRRVEVEDD